VRYHVSHPYKTTGKIKILHILIFIHFDSRSLLFLTEIIYILWALIIISVSFWTANFLCFFKIFTSNYLAKMISSRIFKHFLCLKLVLQPKASLQSKITCSATFNSLYRGHKLFLTPSPHLSVCTPCLHQAELLFSFPQQYLIFSYLFLFTLMSE
jgi:hypothetical protein